MAGLGVIRQPFEHEVELARLFAETEAAFDGLPPDGEFRSHPSIGDVNGDGLGDIVALPRKGPGPRVFLGDGLGHSINNTQLVGIFGDYADPEGGGLGYSGGLYQLTLNNPIEDTAGEPQERIGVEWDNLVTWYAHKALRLEFEANAIVDQGAFR